MNGLRGSAPVQHTATAYLVYYNFCVGYASGVSAGRSCDGGPISRARLPGEQAFSPRGWWLCSECSQRDEALGLKVIWIDICRRSWYPQRVFRGFTRVKKEGLVPRRQDDMLQVKVFPDNGRYSHFWYLDLVRVVLSAEIVPRPRPRRVWVRVRIGRCRGH